MIKAAEVRAQRKRLGLTQRQLARQLGYASDFVVHAAERGLVAEELYEVLSAAMSATEANRQHLAKKRTYRG